MALLLSSSFVVVLNHLMTVEVVAAAKETAPASCHWREVELCTLGFTSLLQNPNGIPLTEPDLKRQCEYMKESKDCLDQYEDKCLTDNQSSLMALFGGDLSDMASEFCDTKSDLRANYTKFGPCLRKVQREVQLNCVTDLRVGFEQIHKANISQRLIIGCCNFNRLKECIMPKIEEKCGDDSVDFVSQLVHRAFGSPLEMLCRDYDPLAFYCTSVLPPSGTKPHSKLIGDDSRQIESLRPPI